MKKPNEPTWFDPEVVLPVLKCRTIVQTTMNPVVECWYDPKTEEFTNAQTQEPVTPIIRWRFY